MKHCLFLSLCMLLSIGVIKADFTMNDIQYWVGEGENRACLVVDWQDERSEPMVWGFKWNGEAKGIDMLEAIARADARFFLLLQKVNTTYNDPAVGGIGFDFNGENTTALYLSNNKVYPRYPFEGVVKTSTINFDNYTIMDEGDLWRSGWTSKGKWVYLTRENEFQTFAEATDNALERVLNNGSWDAWLFDADFTGNPLAATVRAVTPYVEKAVDYTKGVFLLNEDWFGHTNGSLNFLDEDEDLHYRVYTKENPSEAFGCTSQFACIYGDKLYVVSKQEADAGDTEYLSGGRLLIADAKTLKKIKSIDNIGNADGRSFIGVDEKTAYIGTSNGIYLFDIESLEVKEQIEGTQGEGNVYAAQIGNMERAGNRVFAAKQSVGVYVIDAQEHTLEHTIEETGIVSLTQSNDGTIWGASGTALLKINPYTLETERIDFPEGVALVASWNAWNAGSLCASKKENALYFTNQGNFGFAGETVRKYAIDEDEFQTEFLVLPEQTDDEGKALRYRQTFYGAGVRVEPLSGKLIITTTETGASMHYQNNWIHIADGKTAKLLSTKELNKYYWFPAMPFFPDNFPPEVNELDIVELDVNESRSIYLGDKIIDKDNMDGAIVKAIIANSNGDLLSAIIRNDSLILTPTIGRAGKAVVEINCNSNGKTISHSVTINIKETVGINTHSETNPVCINQTTNTIVLNASEGTRYFVRDAQGKVIFANTAKAQQTAVDVQHLPQGLYIIQLENKSYKVIK